MLCLAVLPLAVKAQDAASDKQATTPAFDYQVVRMQEVEVNERKASAINQAPTQSRLEALQPKSTISLTTIANSMAPTADYATIAAIAPNVSNVETNGPGLSESKHLTMRGFDDNQYNVTFDGIPFGDINDFSHHSTSYFPAKLIGEVDIDRGPGTASTIGEATFGGTIAMRSKDPRLDAAFIPTLSFGSWNTRLEHFEANTGEIAGLGGTTAIASYQYMRTDGYRTESDMDRHTTFVKILQPVGKSSQLSFVSSYNLIAFYNPGTITQGTIDTLGRNYGLSNDPTRTDYKGYNHQEKRADFEYIGLESDLGEGFHLSDKFYTFSYDNQSHESSSIGSVYDAKGKPTSMTGALKVNTYRTWGNYLLLSHEDAHGLLKTGLWYDYSRNPRFQYRIDYTRSEALDYDPAKNVSPKNTVQGWAYDMVDFLKTYQAFAEYEWHPVADLTINPGVKQIHFTRDIEARLNQVKPPVPLYYSHTNERTVPYLAANYRITRDMSAYAQVAEGFLAPNLNQFYVANPGNNTVKPQQSRNYQMGFVYKNSNFSGDIDVYAIDFSNFPVQLADPANPSTPIYALAKGAWYKGVEAQGTYRLGYGFGAYANGSLSENQFKVSKLDVPVAPRTTAAAGLVYDGKGLSASLLNKYVGSAVIYGGSLNPDDATTAGDQGHTDAYWNTDFAVSYSVRLGHGLLKSVKVKLQVNNLLDRKVQVLDAIKRASSSAYVPYTDNYYNVLPGRNYSVTFSAEF
jgi:iron complex outermembrane receptor protein